MEKSRMPISFPSLVSLVILLAWSNAYAGDIKVIANSSVTPDSVSPRELKSVFLGEKTRLAGTHVEPVFEKGGPAHESFLRQYLGQSDAELQTYFRTLVVTGRGSMPKAVASDAEVVDFVARTRGAIGYVSATTDTHGAKTLAIANASATERKLLTRVEPVYPEELQKRSIGGTVRLKVTIAPNGNVENAELLGGNPVLGDAAIAAVIKWKYSAAAARTTTEVAIPFGAP